MKSPLFVAVFLSLGAVASSQAASITDSGVTFNFFDGAQASTQQNWQTGPIFGTGWVPMTGGGATTPALIGSSFYGEYYYPPLFWTTCSEALVSFHVTETIEGVVTDHYFTFGGATEANLTFHWTDFYIKTSNQLFAEDDSIVIQDARLYGKPINVPDTGGTLGLLSLGLTGLAGARAFRARRASKTGGVSPV